MFKPELSLELGLQLPGFIRDLSQVPSLLLMSVDWRKVFVKAQAGVRSVNLGQKFPHEPQLPPAAPSPTLLMTSKCEEREIRGLVTESQPSFFVLKMA